MVMHHCELEWHAKRLICYVQGEGGIEGSTKQNMTVSYLLNCCIMSSELLNQTKCQQSGHILTNFKKETDLTLCKMSLMLPMHHLCYHTDGNTMTPVTQVKKIMLEK